MAMQLQESFQQNVLRGNMSIREFFQSLIDEPQDAILELMDWILSETTYSENPRLIKAVFNKLAHLRATAFIAQFEQIRSEWKNTYNNQYEYLHALFMNGLDGASCNCDVYQDASFNVPPYQNDMEILEERTREEGPFRFQVLNLRCKICNTEWQVEVDHIYHYPHSHWKKLSKYQSDVTQSPATLPFSSEDSQG